MSIIIHSMNNSANNEEPKVYREELLLNGEVRSSDNSPQADLDHKLIILHEAVREMFDFIEWDVGERPDIRNEQGGVLIGRRYYDQSKGLHYVVVTKAIPAENAVGSPGYLDITPECWEEMHKKKDEYMESKDEYYVIIGWFHTHPNRLPCFMSGTDRATQEMFFDGENTYAIVINPQRHLIKAFRAKECHAAQALLITRPVTDMGK